jgi:hypothetical protein
MNGVCAEQAVHASVRSGNYVSDHGFLHGFSVSMFVEYNGQVRRRWCNHIRQAIECLQLSSLRNGLVLYSMSEYHQCFQIHSYVVHHQFL